MRGPPIEGGFEARSIRELLSRSAAPTGCHVRRGVASVDRIAWRPAGAADTEPASGAPDSRIHATYFGAGPLSFRARLTVILSPFFIVCRSAGGKCTIIVPSDVFTCTQPFFASTRVTLPSTECRPIIWSAGVWADTKPLPEASSATVM